jgi:hypothetical protein
MSNAGTLHDASSATAMLCGCSLSMLFMLMLL